MNTPPKILDAGGCSVALVTNAIAPRSDEGTKVLAGSLGRALGARGVAVFRLAAGGSRRQRLLLSRSLLSALRTRSRVVLYLPTQSGTPATFFRSSLMRFAGGLRVVLISTQPRGFPAAARLIARRTGPHLILSPSPSVLRMAERMGTSARFLPLGVDTTTFVPRRPREVTSLRKRYGLPQRDPVVLHVGHVRPSRNLEVLMALARAIPRVAPVVVAGRSMGFDADLARRLRGAGVRVIDEFIPSMRDAYAMADCYVFPVEDETGAIGIPLSVLEAMACNLPVVTSRFSGLPRLFPSPGGGFWYADDQPAFVERTGQALRMPRREVQTRERVEPYTWDRIADRVIEEASALCA